MFFKPLLAGANLRDRLSASLGALFGIGLTYAICALALPLSPSLPLLVAPMGASAVLAFAVPASPLAQPWPVVGGNVVSVLVGVAAARLLPPPIAVGAAVGGAIVAMSLLRCLHPPGGAAALIAVIGGSAVTSAGFWFAIAPVGVNAVVLTAAALLFHRFSGHSYPHRLVAKSQGVAAVDDLLHREDIDAALTELGETFDVSHEDLGILLGRAEEHAARRRAAAG